MLDAFVSTALLPAERTDHFLAPLERLPLVSCALLSLYVYVNKPMFSHRYRFMRTPVLALRLLKDTESFYLVRATIPLMELPPI